LFLDELAALAKAVDRPVSWTALLTGLFGRGKAVELVDRTAALGGEVWPQVACRPLGMQLNLADPFPFAMLPTFKEVLALPREQRADLYADAGWRERARPEVASSWGSRWEKASVQETARFGALVGRPLTEVAAERGTEPFDVVVDLSLEEDLQTRFRIVLANDDEEEVGELLQDGRTLLGLSDAGAHASQLCDACFSTHLLGHWTRAKGVLTIEEAVRMLTSRPAEVFGIAGRGRLAEGLAADVTIFDPATVGCSPLRRVRDLPAGADRLVSDAHGIRAVVVNGVVVREDGRDAVDPAGPLPGRVLRGGRAS